MTQYVIYPDPVNAGQIILLIPTGELSITDVAQKDVPAGLPYLIINATDLPPDNVHRSAWRADFTTPTGYGLGYAGWKALHP